MNNNNIYPIFIIILSILIFFAIINYLKKEKLNECFDNLFANSEMIKYNQSLFNGKWSYNQKINNDNTINEPIIIDIYDTPKYENNNSKNNSLNKVYEEDNSSSKYNYGTINLNTNTYTINNIISNVNIKNNDPFNKRYLIASNNISKLTMMILNESETSKLMAYFLFTDIYDVPTLQFISYKLYDNKIPNYAISFINNNKNIINIPKPPFNITVYKNILNNYSYNANLLSFEYGIDNNNLVNFIKNSYGGKLKFSIQRVFALQSGEEITTKCSPIYSLDAINDNKFPKYIIISPVVKDNSTNIENTNIKPVYTILYFYNIIDVANSFLYSKGNDNATLNDFKLKNGANNIYDPTIMYNNLNSIEKTSQNTFEMIQLGTRYNTDLNNPTKIDFYGFFNRDWN